MSPMPRDPSSAGAAMAAIGALRLRDADWQEAPLPAPEAPTQGAARLLHRWSQPAVAPVPGLQFVPHDGNPRHGVLMLLELASGELLDAIEILERQGQWVSMPQPARARLLAARALQQAGGSGLLRSRIAGTPDRRYVFFNTVCEQALLTWVERRRDGGGPPC